VTAGEDVATVCDGIGAVHVAWSPLGWRFVLSSEIDAFPRAVLEQRQGCVDVRRLAARAGGVPLWGDFTALRVRHFRSLGVTLPSLLAGGTPCQAFSIAGLRDSLADARGNLTLQFVKLANAIDAVRRRDGRKPLVIVWENVPGVLSVKDNAFGCFLAGLVGADAPLVPGRGQKWTNSGLVVGPQRTAAWVIRDAQYFGLAQRRRRVFVVASSREGFDPGAVLFEPDRVFRDSPPRREAGQTAAASLTASSGGVSQKDAIDGLVAFGDDIAATLGVGLARGRSPQPGAESASIVAYGGNNRSGPIDVAASLSANKTGSGQFYDFTVETFVHHEVADVAGTLLNNGRAAGSATQQDAESGLLVPMAYSTSGAGYWREGIGALRGRTQDSHENLVAEPIPFDTTQITHPENRSNPQPGDPAPTLAKGGHPPTIAFNSREDPDISEDIAGPLGASLPQAQTIAFSCKDHGADATEGLAPTLRAMGHGDSWANGGGQLAVAIPILESGKRTGASSTGLKAGDGIGDDGDPMYTLGVDSRHTVAFAVRTNQTGANGSNVSEDVAHTVSSHEQPQAVAFALRGREDGAVPEINGDGDSVGTLRAAEGGSSRDYVAFTQDQRCDLRTLEVAGALSAEGGRPRNQETYLATSAVRRLTPTECERLQGYEDGYTAIVWKGRPPEECPDGPRYKALGNSMAIPVMRWLGERIAAEEARRLAEGFR